MGLNGSGDKRRAGGAILFGVALIALGINAIDSRRARILPVIDREPLFNVFPVARWTSPTFSDDFGAARSGGRSHNGIDIFAPIGAAIYAVADGQLIRGTSKLGGNWTSVIANDGTRYYYAHLSQYEGTAPRTVKAGEVIGYVGDTGNAKGTPPHLHFEVHTAGGVLNPYSLLRKLTLETPAV